MAAHALLSASSAHRWLECTVAPRLEVGERDTGSIYAQEGTLAHEIGERILMGQDIEDLKGHELYEPSMLDYVEDYTSYCLEKYHEMKAKDPLASMHVEQRLDFSDYVPEGFGTGDCVLIGNKSLEVIDLKYGRGVTVDPRRNPQLMLYAWGAYSEMKMIYEDIQTVTLTVAQVRTEGINSYTMPLYELKDWMEEEVKPKAALAYQGKGEAVPGSWCTFCKFRNKCKSRNDYYLKTCEEARGRELSKEDMAKIVLIKRDIVRWLDDLSDYVLDEALAGESFPGLKLVEGRSNRKIQDSDLLAKNLMDAGFTEDEIYKPKEIKTITNLEKLAGKKKFEELSTGAVVKPQGKPTLVSESDKRKEYVPIMDEFEFEN